MHNFDGRTHDVGTRTEDGGYAGLVKEVVVVDGNYTSGNHGDVFTTQLLEFFDNGRNQRLVAGGQ